MSRPLTVRKFAYAAAALLFSCCVAAAFGQPTTHKGILFSGPSDGPIRLKDEQGHWIGVAGLSKTARKPNERSVTLAVIDSGVQAEHPQLKGLIAAEKDFTGEGVADVVGHGTIVAILTTAAQQQIDPTGQAPSAVRLLIAKVAKQTPEGQSVDRDALIEAIKWSAAGGAKIVNLSLGFADEREDNEALCAVIASYKDILFVAAAGNSGPQVRVFPAACGADNILAVGADAPWSGVGDVVAPGSVQLTPLR